MGKRFSKGQGVFFETRGDGPRIPAAQAVSTSIEAAKAIAPHVPSLRRRVWNVIGAAGELGITRKEISRRLGMKIQTVTPRCNELLRDELIYQTDERRENSKVLRVTKACW